MASDAELEELRSEVARLKDIVAAKDYVINASADITRKTGEILQELVKFALPRNDRKATIWVLWKPTEERLYAMTRQPEPYQMAAFEKDGYRLAVFAISLPTEVEATPLDPKVIHPVVQSPNAVGG